MLSDCFCENHRLIVYQLLLLSSLLHITTSSVYNVTPDDHYYPNTTCHHCHNLQHYLLNTTKYFTSNTQLLFLPGLHHLHTDLIIQNVHNISLIGSTTNGTTADTVIQCNSSVGIVMINITNLIVTNITVRSCLGNEYNNATVLIKQCTNVQLRHVVIEESHNSYGIAGINVLGDSHFSYITNNAMSIIFNDANMDMENHSLFIDHYHINIFSSNFQCKVDFKLLQQNYRMQIHFINSMFQWLTNEIAFCVTFNNEGIGNNTIVVKHCKFANSQNSAIYLSLLEGYKEQRGDITVVENCQFFGYNNLQNVYHRRLIAVRYGPNIYLNQCKFHHNQKFVALKVMSPSLTLSDRKVVIANTTFLSSALLHSKYEYGFLELEVADLHLIGPVIFHNITDTTYIIKLNKSKLVCSNYIEFSHTRSKAIFWHTYNSNPSHRYFNIFIEQNAVMNITFNHFKTCVSNVLFEKYVFLNHMYPSCYFQYLSNTMADDIINDKYSIVFDSNYEVSGAKYAYKDLPLTHCSWLPQSAFNTTMPLKVNKRYIKYINKSGTYDMLPQHTRQKTLCYCDTNNHYDCNKELLDPIYPGQTIKFTIYAKTIGFNTSNMAITVVDGLSSAACFITNSSQLVQKSKSDTCTTIEYTIVFGEGYKWCELFLKGSYDGSDKINIYSITELPCPPGFVKNSGECKCYPFLEEFNFKCNINDQTILRLSHS